MFDKVKGILYITVIVIVGICCATYMITPFIFYDGIEMEKVFFLHFIELCFLVVAFAILRMYNAVVGNTRFVIKVREAIVSSQKILASLQKEISGLNSSVRELKKSFGTFKKQHDGN